jgi:hypothetical protein
MADMSHFFSALPRPPLGAVCVSCAPAMIRDNGEKTQDMLVMDKMSLIEINRSFLSLPLTKTSDKKQAIKTSDNRRR